MLAETGHEAGSLPLVAHAIRETWARRDGRTLTVSGYKAAGGVSGAIASTAERVYAALAPNEQELLRVILLRMVQPGDGGADTRRRVELSELSALAEGSMVTRIVGQLTDARLVIRDGSSVQPAHDALLRAWPRLGEWIAEQRDDLRRQRHLTSSAQAWIESGFDTQELYRARGSPRRPSLPIGRRSPRPSATSSTHPPAPLARSSAEWSPPIADLVASWPGRPLRS